MGDGVLELTASVCRERLDGHVQDMDIAAGIDLMVVATRPRWCAEDMTIGAAGRFAVAHDYCLDAPLIPDEMRAAWWTPAIHAVRLAAAGINLELQAPGARWVADIDTALTGRNIWAGTFEQLDQCPYGAGFAKPAEAKVSDLEAAWWDNIEDFASAARSAGLPDDANIQIADRHCDLVVEHRCFVIDGVVVTRSAYIDPAGDTWEPEWAQRRDLFDAEARRFADDVTAGLGPNQPSAYVLDVARERDGAWLVLEANPAWCSGWYGCDLTGVADTIIRASVPTQGSHHGRWRWSPDASLIADAARRPVLRRSTPTWLR